AGDEVPSVSGDPPPRTRRRRRRRPKPAAAAGAGSGTSSGTRAKPTAKTKAEQRNQRAGSGGGSKGTKAKGTSAKGTSKKKASAKRPRRHIPTQREVSAGGVVYRREGEDIEIVLASRRTRRGDLAWGLAKGGIEPGESREDAAVREVREETGLDATIEADLGDTKYIYVWEDVRIRKRVHFFLMRHVGGDVDDRDDEMEEIRWFPLERALKRAAYRGEREVLARAAELLQ
ncbi:MAG TPA: NUDIX domain-containing protein, partial [Actinomycetota bacterium]|nr:NUDIX domain-containing protein [Actinomycetota bacterium]